LREGGKRYQLSSIKEKKKKEERSRVLLNIHRGVRKKNRTDKIYIVPKEEKRERGNSLIIKGGKSFDPEKI